jgi:hypothetical protein
VIARKDARAVGGSLRDIFDMYLKVGKKNTQKFHNITPTQPCKNTTPLRPTFVKGIEKVKRGEREARRKRKKEGEGKRGEDVFAFN